MLVLKVVFQSALKVLQGGGKSSSLRHLFLYTFCSLSWVISFYPRATTELLLWTARFNFKNFYAHVLYCNTDIYSMDPRKRGRDRAQSCWKLIFCRLSHNFFSFFAKIVELTETCKRACGYFKQKNSSNLNLVPLAFSLLTTFFTSVSVCQRDQIWRNFATLSINWRSLGKFLDGLFCIWQTFVHTLAFFMLLGKLSLLQVAIHQIII